MRIVPFVLQPVPIQNGGPAGSRGTRLISHLENKKSWGRVGGGGRAASTEVYILYVYVELAADPRERERVVIRQEKMAAGDRHWKRRARKDIRDTY